MKREELIALARTKAEEYGLPAVLVCAVCEQESGWNEFAHRYEPRFMSKYVSPIFLSGQLTPTEAYARAYSWGLMQVMGQVAREQGFRGVFLSELCDPWNGLDQGCIKLAKCMKRHGDDQRAALLQYNGGGETKYPDMVFARMVNY